MNNKFRVGILGATGVVGQRFIQLLDGHPQFEVSALAASDRSQGKSYAEACTWRLPGEMPEWAKRIAVQAPAPPLECDFVFSSLPGDIAAQAEEDFARAGYPVITNSSPHRMSADVPLLIPEVNPDHVGLIEVQRKKRGYERGFIVTNPNCSAIAIVMALAPLHAKFGVTSCVVTTMQALSGAGYPGVPSLDATDNVIPFIGGEEEKVEAETLKLLGRLEGDSIQPAAMTVSAQCNRVNVTDGHMASIRVKLGQTASLADIREAWSSFSALPQQLQLHSAPRRPVIVRDEKDRPQPRLDRDAGKGMSVTVGRIMPDTVFDYRFVALGHNTIRGAAGAAILNAELLVAGVSGKSLARQEGGEPQARMPARQWLMFSVALICTANRCRSIMAHAILADETRKRSLAMEIYSAGVSDFSDQPPLIETSRTCLHYNTPTPKRTPTFAAELPLPSIDRFLVMEQRHADALQNQFGIAADRISLLGTFDPKHRGAEIDDPFFSYSEEVYRRSYRRIRDCIIEYLDTADEVR